eukprot:CAMPEP_0198419596 /NCGR_PEP_ID=MMETSP1452-20131203/317_1 /TAXON_ID=1181717 /ORGANISM="Synchroma pusillum, Strain CCMP3072" /LENGTH=1042 /DNA_ID=CAMNT_0044139729 /DNA_START=1 /DNA_END=3129 /DNA_ORIENTATION=-
MAAFEEAAASLSALCDTLLASGAGAADASVDFAGRCVEAGPVALKASGVVDKLRAKAVVKNAAEANAALSGLKALSEAGAQWVEPFVLGALNDVLEAFSSPKTANAAEAAGRALVTLVSPYALKLVVPMLFESMNHIKWQAKRGAIVLLGALASSHPEQFKRVLPEVVEKLIEMCQDLKKQVKDAALTCFAECAAVIGNIDIEPIIPDIIKAYAKPVEETSNGLDRLVATTFVNEVDMPTLALLVPLLVRAMRERQVAYKRRSAVVMGNMCKLVNDPRDAAAFIGILEPVLLRGIEEISIEEVRNVCQKSLDQLRRVSAAAADKTALMFSRDQVDAAVREAVAKHGGPTVEDQANVTDVIDYSVSLVHMLVVSDTLDDESWTGCHVPYLSSFMPAEGAAAVCDELVQAARAPLTAAEVDPEADEEDLCDATFSLAYGTRVLLHQTRLKVKRGRKYGLIGQNGCGKSTLMKAIASGNLQGFPEDLKTVYVEHEIQGSDADTPVWEYVANNPRVQAMGVDEATVRGALGDVGFGQEMQDGPVSALSGGWKMKLALSRAMLLEPDMLLLDEPTNHLDIVNVAWITEYIQNLRTCTCLLVSHDTGFLDNVCTNILHYENLKLKPYRGNLSEFVKQKPEARAYFELASQTTAFNFPDPGPLEGVKSLTKAVLKMQRASFQYPTAPRPQLINVSIQCSLASRVAVLGPNGAGKSTLVKVMVGELEPDSGEIYRHPNLRIAYVAQHAFHHIEQHLDKTPVEYIQWRYSGGTDKEQAKKETLQMTEEEKAKIAEEAKKNKQGVVERIVGRRNGKREHEYEVEWEGGFRENSFLTRRELEELGYQKMLQEFDEELAMQAMLGARMLTTGEISGHLAEFGLEEQFSQHTNMGALSGGQKVKVVLGAGMWNLPHILILDEPTNFLDRDSLGALAAAIRNFKGGVFMISHNAEFYEALCPERWVLHNGECTVQGSEWMAEVEAARIRQEKADKKKLKLEQEDKFDAHGNKIEQKDSGGKKELSRQEKKRLMKQRKEMAKRGEDTFEIDELLGLN